MDNNIFKKLKEFFPNLQKNIPLKNHTTFKIGGPAKYFLIAKDKKSLLKAIRIAKNCKLPVFVMGGGSNLLVSDKGFAGLVIKIQFTRLSLKLNNVIVFEAGLLMKDLINAAIKKELAGLEWAGGLPGTVGGAIRGNAGAFGGEIKDSILQVEALDSNLKLRKCNNKQCGFSYRSSIFKRENWPVLSASVRLKNGDKKELAKISNSHINYRKEKHPLEYPNAGSVFKNVDVKKIPPKFKKLFLDKVKKDPFPIVPSAWIIIEAGLVGKKIGRAQISKKHSNYIVNLGNAKAQDVLKLIAFVKRKVKEKYGIILEQEIQYLE